MFGPIITFLTGIFAWFKYAITTYGKGYAKWFAIFWAALVLFADWFWFVLDKVKATLADALLAVGNLALPEHFTPETGLVASTFMAVNTFFPLDELFTYLIAILTLRFSLFVMAVAPKLFRFALGL